MAISIGMCTCDQIIGNTIKSVLRGHLREKEKKAYKIGDLLTEIWLYFLLFGLGKIFRGKKLA
jgi:hypothetical protein